MGAVTPAIVELMATRRCSACGCGSCRTVPQDDGVVCSGAASCGGVPRPEKHVRCGGDDLPRHGQAVLSSCLPSSQGWTLRRISKSCLCLMVFPKLRFHRGWSPAATQDGHNCVAQVQQLNQVRSLLTGRAYALVAASAACVVFMCNACSNMPLIQFPVTHCWQVVFLQGCSWQVSFMKTTWQCADACSSAFAVH